MQRYFLFVFAVVLWHNEETFWLFFLRLLGSKWPRDVTQGWLQGALQPSSVSVNLSLKRLGLELGQQGTTNRGTPGLTRVSRSQRSWVEKEQGQVSASITGFWVPNARSPSNPPMGAPCDCRLCCMPDQVGIMTWTNRPGARRPVAAPFVWLDPGFGIARAGWARPIWQCLAKIRDLAWLQTPCQVPDKYPELFSFSFLAFHPPIAPLVPYNLAHIGSICIHRIALTLCRRAAILVSLRVRHVRHRPFPCRDCGRRCGWSDVGQRARGGRHSSLYQPPFVSLTTNHWAASWRRLCLAGTP